MSLHMQGQSVRQSTSHFSFDKETTISTNLLPCIPRCSLAKFFFTCRWVLGIPLAPFDRASSTRSCSCCLKMQMRLVTEIGFDVDSRFEMGLEVGSLVVFIE